MVSNVTELVPPFLIEDLARSGLGPDDMRARIAGPGEKQATNTPLGVDAYVLPYFNIEGKPIPFYRTKLIDHLPKYKQLATTGNHVYFPKGFMEAFNALQGPKYILITEGEKKAAAATKAGFPCCGLSGVDSWRNRTVVFHKDSQIGQTKSGQIVARLPAGAEVKDGIDVLAEGIRELISLAQDNKAALVLCYDTELKSGKPHIPFEVQRAAAQFGFELRNRGVDFVNIRQLQLAPKESQFLREAKLGLDDFLVHQDLGPVELSKQLAHCLAQRTAFPKHPNPKEYINKKLQKGNLNRSDVQSLSTAMICDLDSKGIRLHCPNDDMMYYFDERVHKLTKIRFTQGIEFGQTPFGIKLYNDYNITPADSRILLQFASQFSAEQPIQQVRPERVLTIRGDTLYYQLSDGQMLKVNADAMRVLNNGSDDILFEGDSVLPIDPTILMDKIRQVKEGNPEDQPMNNIWYPVLKEVRVAHSEDDKARKILALLYNISPWMYKWRATQLPIEQVTGEPGAGKSTLFTLRLDILTGIPTLRNAPNDLRDWTASIASTGGLHVTDNVHMTNSKLRQELSDELCRCVTEEQPYVERRKLYSDNELVRTPVKTVFGVTGIRQPFTNADIVQRSIITQLDKGTDDISYDADWEKHVLSRLGGREMWLAYQFVFQQRLFQKIRKEWTSGYKAKFRLINLEQLLRFTAEIYGWEHDWIASFLEQERADNTAAGDAALQGLIAWADEIREFNNEDQIKRTAWTTKQIVEWALTDDDFAQNKVLSNGRVLGNYLKEHKNSLAKIIGLAPFEGKTIGNRQAYVLRPPKQDGVTKGAK